MDNTKLLQEIQRIANEAAQEKRHQVEEAHADTMRWVHQVEEAHADTMRWVGYEAVRMLLNQARHILVSRVPSEQDQHFLLRKVEDALAACPEPEDPR